MFWIAVAIAWAAMSTAAVFIHRQQGVISVRKAELAEQQAIRSAQEVKELFASEERGLAIQRDTEIEVARRLRLEEERRVATMKYEIEQTRLAQSIVDKLGKPEGDLIMKGHSQTFEDMLRAVVRQLDDLDSRGREKPQIVNARKELAS